MLKRSVQSSAPEKEGKVITSGTGTCFSASWSGVSGDPWREEGVCAALSIRPLCAVFPAPAACESSPRCRDTAVEGGPGNNRAAHTQGSEERLKMVLEEAIERSDLEAGQSGRAAGGGSL